MTARGFGPSRRILSEAGFPKILIDKLEAVVEVAELIETSGILTTGLAETNTNVAALTTALNTLRDEVPALAPPKVTGGGLEDGTYGNVVVSGGGLVLTVAESLVVAVSDETTAITAGTAKITFRMPYAFTLTAVRASLTTAQATNGGGGIFTVDINEAGSTILSTKLTIDNTEKTSTTAATPAVISDASLADNAEMTIDVDQVGDGTATGLKITFIGNRT